MSKKRARCGGKFVYATFDRAVHAALVSNRRCGEPLRPYQCATCGGGWHLTRNPGGTWVATVPAPFAPADMARLVNRNEDA